MLAAPLLPIVTLSLTLGIALALGTGCGGAWPLLLCAACCAAGLAVGHRLRPLAALALLVLSALGAGAGITAARLRPPRPPCHVARLADGATVRTLHAQVQAGPERFPGRGAEHRGGERFRLRALALAGPRPRSLCGSLELTRPLGARPLAAGERILLRTRLYPATGSRLPGSQGSRLRYLSHDVGALATVHQRDLLVLRPRPLGLTQRARARLRRLMARRIRAGAGRQIVGALTLGARGQVTPELRQRFARAGLSHLLAVSGLHLALLAGGVMLLLRLLLLRVGWLARRVDVRVIAAPLALCLAWGYAQLSGAAPSTLRACVMTSAAMAGLCASRPRQLLRPLALAALLLLAWDPLNLLRPGFQLSFLAVTGIALAAHGAAFRPGLWGALASLVRASLAATLFTAPVVAYHFHQVSLAGLLTNLVAIPFTSFLLLPLSLLGAALGLVSAALGGPVLQLAGSAAALLDGLCNWVAGLDGLVLRWSPGGWTAAAGTAVAASLWLARRHRRRLLLLACLLLLLPVGQRVVRALAPRVRVTFLDVGQGDSTLVQLPSGEALLVDAGGSSSGRWDPGALRVVPFLARRGLRRLDVVLLTHPHPDHMGGLAAVLRAVSVGELWLCAEQPPSPAVASLLSLARERGVRVGPPRPWRRGQVRLQPLWPAATGNSCGDPGLSENDNSVVLKLQYGAASLLLAGDVERDAEQQLVQQAGSQLLATVLKVPHHGSATSSSMALVRAVSPRLAVISCGVANRFGFPHAKVLQRYRQVGAAILRLDRLGALEVSLARSGQASWRRLSRF